MALFWKISAGSLPKLSCRVNSVWPLKGQLILYWQHSVLSVLNLLVTELVFHWKWDFHMVNTITLYCCHFLFLEMGLIFTVYYIHIRSVFSERKEMSFPWPAFTCIETAFPQVERYTAPVRIKQWPQILWFII